MPNNILYFIGSLDRGGAETHLLRILTRLNKKHFQAKIFLLSNEGEMFDEFQKNGIEIIVPWIKGGQTSKILRLVRMIVLSLQILLYLLIHRPKIVHFFLPASYLLAGPLSILCAIPLRIMSRRSLNHYQEAYPSFVRKLEYWLHHRMHALLGNSQKVVNQLIEEEGAETKRTHLLYNGVAACTPSTKDMRIELQLDKNSLVFIIVANLIPYKGHQDLINAFSKVDIKGNWDLLIVGNDSAQIQNELINQASKLDLNSHIHFLGQRSDIPDLLHCANIGLLVSHEEGFSNAILEGMAASLPMIVTDVGGNREAVIHEETGLIVPPKDSEALALALQRLSDAPDFCQRAGKAGKSRQEKHFSLEACVNAYEVFYTSILEEKH